jgi:hypothetical protein
VFPTDSFYSFRSRKISSLILFYRFQENHGNLFSDIPSYEMKKVNFSKGTRISTKSRKNSFSKSGKGSLSSKITSEPTQNPTANSPTSPPTSSPTDVTIFTTYFGVEYATSCNDIEIERIRRKLREFPVAPIQALPMVYNDLKEEKYDDPYNRKMNKAVIVDLSRARRQLSGNSRALQNLNIFVFLRVSGFCSGCGNDPFFTNQIVRRELFDKNNVFAPSDALIPGIPTAEAVLEAYSDVLASGDFECVQDVESLEEMANLPKSGKGDSSSSKSSKRSSKGASGKGGLITSKSGKDGTSKDTFEGDSYSINSRLEWQDLSGSNANGSLKQKKEKKSSSRKDKIFTRVRK